MEITRALTAARPDEEWTIQGNDFNTLVWLSNTAPPTLQELQTAWADLVAEENSQASRHATARNYAKLRTLQNMTPAQIQSWVASNVTNFGQAQDAITTLAIAVSVLAKRI